MVTFFHFLFSFQTDMQQKDVVVRSRPQLSFSLACAIHTHPAGKKKTTPGERALRVLLRSGSKEGMR